MKEQIYHVLITKRCTHNCPLCCNRLYDLDALPSITFKQLRKAHTVCLTGGEPFLLEPNELIRLCKAIREQSPNIQKVYIYSSGFQMYRVKEHHWRMLLPYINGLNFAPKDAGDWVIFEFLCNHWLFDNMNMSNRLYVFDDQWSTWENLLSRGFEVPDNLSVIGRKWDKTFNTPDNEHFVRLPILY